MKNKDDIFIEIMLVIYGAIMLLLGVILIAHIYRSNVQAEQAMNAAHYERVYLAGGVK